MNYSDIIGNSDTKEYLLKTVNSKNILHSYLFLGTSGIGKKMIAKVIAKKILCLDENKDNCSCKSCVCFDTENHPDFFLINDSGENIKIDEIRKITDKVIEKPIISSKKVYIINDCEKMTKEAQNCLLKTLEEPPEFVVIILISSNENLILNTIKSRCMKLQFKNIPNNELKKYATENLEYTNLSENMLQAFGGSIQKAIALKDNKDKYSNIDLLVKNLNKKDIIDILLDSKFIYDKENIFEFLEYLIVCLYAKSKENSKYVYCIDKVNNAINRLRSNSNFDMTIDTMLLKMWEDVNENCYRS